MSIQTITRPSAVEPSAALAAQRALKTADNPYTVRSLYRAFRWAEAASEAPGITDDQVDALADQSALIWGMIVRTPISSRFDAVIKLELAADGAGRMDGDVDLIRQVRAWLLNGGVH